MTSHCCPVPIPDKDWQKAPGTAIIINKFNKNINILNSLLILGYELSKSFGCQGFTYGNYYSQCRVAVPHAK